MEDESNELFRIFSRIGIIGLVMISLTLAVIKHLCARLQLRQVYVGVVLLFDVDELVKLVNYPNGFACLVWSWTRVRSTKSEHNGTECSTVGARSRLHHLEGSSPGQLLVRTGVRDCSQINSNESTRSDPLQQRDQVRGFEGVLCDVFEIIS